jgi:hypothetical protein
MISFYDLTFSVDSPKVAIVTFAQIINLITSEVNKKMYYDGLLWTYIFYYIKLKAFIQLCKFNK